VFRRPAARAGAAERIDLFLTDRLHRAANLQAAQAHAGPHAANCALCHKVSPDDVTMLRRAWLDAYGMLTPAPAKPGDATAREKELEAKITQLQAELSQLRGQNRAARVFPKADLGLEPTEMLSILNTLATKRFGKDAGDRLQLSAESDELRVGGDAEAVRWAQDMIGKLSGK
jgi:hypothetical protein